MITRKASGTNRFAPGAPSCSNLRAKIAATAAHTIPRGPIQAIIVFSLRLKSLPIDETNTEIGLAIKMMPATTSIEVQPTATKPARSIRAARTINKPLIRSSDRLSLKSSMSSTSTPRWFATIMPNIVTASSPDSCSIVSDSAKATNTINKVKGLRRYSGNHCFRRIWDKPKPKMMPMPAPIPTTFRNSARISIKTSELWEAI